MVERFTTENARRLAAESEQGSYGLLLQRGTLELGFYTPKTSDPQTAHDQDEVYVIQSGSGYFVHGEERRPFEAGEALFIPAGDAHRFEDFTDDFAAWVIFYGLVGGE